MKYLLLKPLESVVVSPEDYLLYLKANPSVCLRIINTVQQLPIPNRWEFESMCS